MRRPKSSAAAARTSAFQLISPRSGGLSLEPARVDGINPFEREANDAVTPPTLAPRNVRLSGVMKRSLSPRRQQPYSALTIPEIASAHGARQSLPREMDIL